MLNLLLLRRTLQNPVGMKTYKKFTIIIPTWQILKGLYGAES